MMRLRRLILLALATGVGLLPQRLQGQLSSWATGYEWLEMGRPYIRLRIATGPSLTQTFADVGVFRVTGAQLALARPEVIGQPVAGLHLYFNGLEEPIYVSGVGDPSVFEPEDYIEFYGGHRNAKLDSLLFRTSDAQGGLDPTRIGLPNISQVSNEAQYYLSWDTTPGLRYQTVPTRLSDLTGLSPEAQYRHLDEVFFASSYQAGSATSLDPRYTNNADFTTGEGLAASPITTPATGTYTRSNLFPAPVATSPPELRFRYTPFTLGSHSVRVSLGSAQVFDNFSDFVVREVTLQGLQSELASGSVTVGAAPTLPNERIRHNRLQLRYDRLFRYNGQRFVGLDRWTPTTAGAHYLRLEGLDIAATDSAYVYDLTNRRRLVGVVRQQAGASNRDTLLVYVPPSSGDHRLFAFTTTAVRTVAQANIAAYDVAGTFLPENEATFLILTHRSLAASAEAYKQYRDTCTVNPQRAKVVYMDEIYDEYGYGALHPVATKRMIATALSRWQTPPQFVLLWGKANQGPNRDTPRHVHTWGNPASDIEFVGNYSFTQRNHEPVIPIGRVSIDTDAEGLAYLAKVDFYEHQAFEPWMKDAIHLGGGNTVSEQQQIRAVLDGLLAPIKEDAPLFGEVFYHQKNSLTTVDVGTSTEIRAAINAGAGVLTFLGHSATNIFDIEIEAPENYENTGRYPLVLANGCYAGNFAAGASSNSFGEQWVKADNKGCIGWLSVPNQGIISYMADVLREVYTLGYQEQPQIRQGVLQQEAIRRYLNRDNHYTDIFAIQHAQQYNLQGDPSIWLQVPTAPDLVAEDNLSITFSPENPTIFLDSFQVKVAVRNLGLQATDSFTVQLEQRVLTQNRIVRFPDRRVLLSGPSDTLVYTVPMAGDSLRGVNEFAVVLDSRAEVAELTEANNLGVASVTVASDIPVVIFPGPFQALSADTLTLRAAFYNDTQHGPVTYYFELDTLPTFTSPARVQSGPVAGTHYLGSYRPAGPLYEGVPYYWRVRIETERTDGWANASFSLTPGQPTGWRLASPPQFAEGGTEDLTYSATTRRFSYRTAPIEIDARAQRLSYEVLVNGSSIVRQAFREYGGSGVFYTLFDPVSGDALLPEISPYGRMRLLAATDSAGLKQLMDTLRPNTGVVLMGGHTHGFPFPTRSESFKSSLRSVGASGLENQPANQGFVLLGRKGLPQGQAIEALVPVSTNRWEAFSDTMVRGVVSSGAVQPLAIGPVAAWGSLVWGWTSVDPGPGDSGDLAVRALRADGTDSLVVAAHPAGSLLDLSALDAGRFPFLSVQATLTDATYRTPPQPDSIVVGYTPLPELTLDALTEFDFGGAELAEGAEQRVRIGVRNLSEQPTDSAWASLVVTPTGATSVPVGQLRIPPLAPGAFVVLADTFSTRGLSGASTLRVEANAAPALAERYRFNNSFRIPFAVARDRVNPAVDILFDGRQIVNGEIVAPRPVISIEARDDNPNLLLSDTTTVEVYLNPRDATPIPGAGRVFYAPGLLEFTPATEDGGNRARVTYTPELPDGEYVLQVRVVDASGNLAGTEPYEVAFQVTSESRLTQIINYPNPFSTQTRWVYTLTGSVLPEVFQVHIYTVSGRLVKVIDLVELGEVAVGTYETRWAWDGTDTYGDPLANGVYLYRTVVKMPGNAEVKFDTSQTAQFFEKGWGKLVILR